MRKLFLVVAAISLTACASAGVKVEEAKLKSFEKGKTTASEVVTTLGPPTARSVTADGITTISYNYASSQIRPATFIPIVGLFAGGSDTRHSAVEFKFDKQGLLADYTSSEGEIGASVGPR
jgi:hypothetical protein